MVPQAIDVVVLLTQTCDLQDTTPEQRTCQVAPVVERGKDFAHEVRRGRRPGWVAVPWYRPDAVAELARITTLERSVLVGAQSLGKPGAPREQLHFAESVSRHFTRVALPDPVVKVLRPLLERMRDKHGRTSDEGLCMRQVGDLRLEAFPDLDAISPHLRVLVILEAKNLPALAGAEVDNAVVDELVRSGDRAAAAAAALHGSGPAQKRQGWQALAELWLQRAAQLAADTPNIDGIEIVVLNDDELSFARARNAPELDLAYLTTRPD